MARRLVASALNRELSHAMRRLAAQSSRRRGFTLIELLVVIAVVALLIAILLPALSHARRSARLTACVANLRSQGQVVLTYTNDFQESLPPRGVFWNRKEEDDQYEQTFWTLPRLLANYQGHPFARDGDFFPPTGAWRCVEIRPEQDDQHINHFAISHSCAGRFAYNSVLRDDETGEVVVSADAEDGWETATLGWRRLTNFTWPTRLVALGDALTFFAEVHQHRHAMDSVGRSWQLVTTDIYDVIGYHAEPWPIVHFDGHAETRRLTAQQWLDSTETLRSPSGGTADFHRAEIDAFLWFVRR